MPSGAEKLSLLRNLMKNVVLKDKKGIEAYIVTSDDSHNSEYVQERDKRRQYISGFKGSAGTVVITLEKALLWTDGRYYTQAEYELDPPGAWILMKQGLPDTPSIEKWLSDNLPANSTVGTDPFFISELTANQIKNSLEQFGDCLHFEPIQNNLIDEIWGKDKPAQVLNKILPQKLIYSGKTAGDKVVKCFEEMEKNKVSVLVVTALDEIAYLLNWRGSDITYNPVFFSFVILFSKKVHIFVQEERLTSEARQQLIDEKVDFEIHPYQDVRPFLKKLCSEEKNCKRVWLPSSSSYVLHTDCGLVPIHKKLTPLHLMKSIKNETEIAGMKSAHIKDAVAIVKYFAWLENKTVNQASEDSTVTEITGVQQLEKFREEQENYVGPSFGHMSASGKHAAIIHYEPSPETDTPITSKDIYLCDVGSQFFEGTTDVTRTLHFGQPTEFEKECFTRVFKGQYSLAVAKFPASTLPICLDALARQHLRNVGLDYRHGTGHGIGAYLNVHEIPPNIMYRTYPEDNGLHPGMFLSNEPGYYEDGQFGIRLENVALIVKANTVYSRVNCEFYTFETVTLVPIQTKLLNISLLTDEEISYLNDYHKKCLNTLKPLLKGPENSETLVWLERETKPIQK